MIETNDIVSFIKKFHDAGWMPGSVGAVAQLIVHNESSKKILVTPDKLDVNTLTTSDFFTLRDLYGTQEVQAPVRGNTTISRWASSLFYLLGKNDARCIAFLPTKNACLLGRKSLELWHKQGGHPNQLRLSHWGLLRDLGCTADTAIPIIDSEGENALSQIEHIYELYVQPFPAILVRNYGVFSWEGSLPLLKNKLELLERLFELQLNLV